jgi:uncharacterized membrane protein
MMMVMMMIIIIIIIIIIINYLRPPTRAGSAKSEINVFAKRAYDRIIKTENDFTPCRCRTF